MGISQILSDVKNIVNAQSFSFRNYLGKAVVQVKDNPIPVIVSIICIAAVSLGIKCYNSFNFFKKEPELALLPAPKITQITNDKLKELQDKFEQELKENNEKLEKLLKSLPKKQEMDLKAIEEKFENQLEAIEKNLELDSEAIVTKLVGKAVEPETPTTIVEEFEEITLSLKPKSTPIKVVEIENEFPPSDLPPMLPLSIQLKEAYENYLGEKVEGIDESWLDSETPPSDLPPMLPLSIRLKEAYENYLGEKVEVMDEAWFDSDTPPTDLPPMLPLVIRLKEVYENYSGEKVEGIDQSWDAID